MERILKHSDIKLNLFNPDKELDILIYRMSSFRHIEGVIKF